METDLTSKLPLREHMKNIRKILRVVAEMDKTYFPTACIVHLINVAVPYISLILSAYILDALTEGKSFEEILFAALASTAGIFLLHVMGSTVWNNLEVRRQNMYYLYSCITEEKMLDMDFSRIDSPPSERFEGTDL